MPPTTATLVYRVTPTNVLPTATMQAKMAAVPLYASALTDPVLKTLFDCTVASDATAPAGPNIDRTIVLNLGAGFFSLFPTAADWATAFNDLFGRTLALLLPAQVKSLPVVFA